MVNITDPKALAHFLARDTWVYHQTTLMKTFIDNLFGRGIIYVEQEDHRRQRKALSPAFSVAANRGYLSVFYDSAYKVKSRWETLLDNGNPTIEVQSWMNFSSLDDIGVACFGHAFGALDGEKSDVATAFDAFESPNQSGWLARIIFLFTPMLPILQKLPTRNNQIQRAIKSCLSSVADRLIQHGKDGLDDAQGSIMDKSMMALLIKAGKTSDSGLSLTKAEVLAQINTLMFAGYETTSIGLTWALIELSRNPDAQEALREELSQFQTNDPTWENLSSGLPYLNGVVLESLRLHPPIPTLNRSAKADDIIPLSTPITLPDGNVVSEIYIAKGTKVSCPVAYINQAEEFWGLDAKEFKPERWINNNITPKGKALQGYHHLLTFSDGPQFCLGRNFAVLNFKAKLSVLIRNFSFELPGGVDTKIGRHLGIMRRPKLEGTEAAQVPLVVRQIK